MALNNLVPESFPSDAGKAMRVEPHGGLSTNQKRAPLFDP